jgi:DNA-binding MarR family transcriptional regulator
MSTQQFARPPTRSLPEDVSSAQAKLVYHSLDAAGPADVDELADRLGMKKITLLEVLSSLDGRGHVVRRDGEYGCC